MAKLALMCALAASLLTGSAIAEVDFADALKTQSSITYTAAKNGKNEKRKENKESKKNKENKKKSAKKTENSKKKESAKKTESSKKKSSQKSVNKQNKAPAKKGGKSSAIQQKNSSLKDNKSKVQQNVPVAVEQKKDILTRMLEAKTLAQQTVDNINAYLKNAASIQNANSSPQSAESENAALSQISAFVKEGKLKEKLLKVLENFVKQTKTAEAKDGTAADIQLTQSALQAMLQSKVITQDEYNAIAAQLTQDLLEEAQKAKFISQAEYETAKPLFQQTPHESVSKQNREASKVKPVAGKKAPKK